MTVAGLKQFSWFDNTSSEEGSDSRNVRVFKCRDDQSPASVRSGVLDTPYGTARKLLV